jgi:O-antigen ligase
MAEQIIYSKHLFYKNIKKSKPSLTPRELAVFAVAATILIIMPWAWGGVVWWATMLTLGLSAGALIIAVGNFRTQAIFAGIWAILLTTVVVLSIRGFFSGAEQTLNYICFPSTALFAQLLGAALLYDDVKSKSASESFKNLLKCVPFWMGLALFAYFAIQALNTWGSVTERDLFWRIFKEPYITWLPNGLNAPFISDEHDPSGMNAWRVLLTFAGPWMFFCALYIGLLRRRGYVTLAWISVITAVILAAYGYTNQLTEGDIFGYPVPSNARTFGPFINRTHACTYFYFNAAIALSLAFWHFRRKKDSSRLGGPHLISLFIALLLFFGVFLTFSVGGILISLTLLLFVAPLAYFLGLPIKNDKSLGVSFINVIIFAIMLGGLAYTYKYDQLEYRIREKLKYTKDSSLDERVALRSATEQMISVGGVKGKVWYGWGAGSYRWVSPYFQAQQPSLQGKDGKLSIRAIYAHCDWLQIIAEWGLVGLLPVLISLGWFILKSRRIYYRGRPEVMPIFCVCMLFLIHMFLDLLCWFTPILFILAFTAAMTLCTLNSNSVIEENS